MAGINTRRDERARRSGADPQAQAGYSDPEDDEDDEDDEEDEEDEDSGGADGGEEDENDEDEGGGLPPAMAPRRGVPPVQKGLESYLNDVPTTIIDSEVLMKSLGRAVRRGIMLSHSPIMEALSAMQSRMDEQAEEISELRKAVDSQAEAIDESTDAAQTLQKSLSASLSGVGETNALIKALNFQQETVAKTTPAPRSDVASAFVPQLLEKGAVGAAPTGTVLTDSDRKEGGELLEKALDFYQRTNVEVPGYVAANLAANHGVFSPEHLTTLREGYKTAQAQVKR